VPSRRARRGGSGGQHRAALFNVQPAGGDDAFIAAVGADSPHKGEIAPSLMAKAMIVADVHDQCAIMGDLRLALASGLVAPGDVHAELHELVAGRKSGRSSDAQIILFDSTGTALQDVAAAALLYERAAKAPGLSVALGAAA